VDDETSTQRASRKLADALFADPELRGRFEMIAKETVTREPVPDDFGWLSQSTVPSSEFSGFKALTRKLLGAPKPASDADQAKDH